MSIRLMSMIWEIEFPTQSQLLIALKLADFANDDGGSVYPSRNRLARNAQCSESTVKSVMRAFRSVGLLHVVREGGHGPKSTTEYAWNLQLLRALFDGHCIVSGTSEAVEIEWITKGAEFDPLTGLRGQSDPLRGQPGGDKGSAGYPQPFNNHHKELPMRESARATHSAARSRSVEMSRLVTSEDREWSLWLSWLSEEGLSKARQAFEAEGRMVVFAPMPCQGMPKPKLAPTDGSPLLAALMADREAQAHEQTH